MGVVLFVSTVNFPRSWGKLLSRLQLPQPRKNSVLTMHPKIINNNLPITRIPVGLPASGRQLLAGLNREERVEALASATLLALALFLLRSY
jgi:hypothetical protein